MVCTSVDVGIQDVSIHSWAEFGHKTTRHLPIVFMVPFLLLFLCQSLIPTEPKLRETMINLLIRGSQLLWPTQGKRNHYILKRLRKRKKQSIKTSLRTYLLLIIFSLLKVGCCIEIFLHRWRLGKIMALHCMREPPMALYQPSNLTRTRFQLELTAMPPGAWRTPLTEGIKQRLDIKGIGTFKFKIDDNDGNTHQIRFQTLFSYLV